ncbi:hypothetical protein C0J52_27974 [Blattella germanica]|nr:hypothetical protein C0J52_27974 [Blattella germanica]
MVYIRVANKAELQSLCGGCGEASQKWPEKPKKFKILTTEMLDLSHSTTFSPNKIIRIRLFKWHILVNPTSRQTVRFTVGLYRYNRLYVSVWMNFWLTHNSNKYLEKDYVCQGFTG